MTRAQQILNQLNLDYKTIVVDAAWQISPMDFLSKIKIILVITDDYYSMFIWKDNTIQCERKFKEVGNITDIYSFLYNYDSKNLKNKKNVKTS